MDNSTGILYSSVLKYHYTLHTVYNQSTSYFIVHSCEIKSGGASNLAHLSQNSFPIETKKEPI